MKTSVNFRKVKIETIIALGKVPGFKIRQFKMNPSFKTEWFQVVASYMDEFTSITYSSHVLEQQVDGIEISKY